jgi:hypothetical protein
MKWILLTLLFIGCNEAPVSESPEEVTKKDNHSRDCVGIESIRESKGDPQTIAEAMDLIAALPKPLEMKCFVQALKRPLYLNATSSILSAQPAQGPDSPRMFIIKNNLILSLTLEGNERDLLEFAELKSTVRSIKGEVEFPLDNTVDPLDPYRGVDFGGQTNCSACHSSEILEETIDNVPIYSSKAFRPKASKDVPITDVARELYLCEFYENRKL